MVKEGHIVGNHSWHHPDLSKVSEERFTEELEKVRVKTKTLTGQKIWCIYDHLEGRLVNELWL